MPEIDRRTLLTATAAGAVGLAAAVNATGETGPSLAGKTVLITGASSGFGEAGALHYARLGARVFATMRNLPRPEADALLRRAREEKLTIEVIAIDVLDEAQVNAAVAEAERRTGGAIDILVNNAGIGITGPVELQDSEAMRLAFDTNVFGCQRLIRAVLPGMRRRKAGLIFNLSSQLGRVIAPGAGHYSATKFALEALSEQLAYELVPHGIEVCVIQPGGYPTKVWVNRNRYTAALRDRIEAERKAAYPGFVAGMGNEDGSGRSADVLDVPRAIAEIAAMAPGTRPLRRAVHPGARPQEAINRVCRDTQLAWLGGTAYGPMIRAVHD